MQRDLQMKRIPVLLHCGALGLALAACDANAADLGAASSTSLFFVDDAAPAHPGWYDRLPRPGTDDGDVELPNGFPTLAHRIVKGAGTVLSERTARDDPSVVDEESTSKVTLYFPEGLPIGQTDISFRDGDSGSGASGVMVNTAIAWGKTCIGYPASGSIHVDRSSDGALSVDIDIKISWTGRAGGIFKAGCPEDFRYRRRAAFQRKSVAELTPWEGGADGPITPGETWPEFR